MAVLAASICTHGGKVLVSRQFRDLSKDRLAGLLAKFPLLLLLGSQTTVEDEHCRYVYQPLEEYYVVLVTSKQLNILQDIDTLHLFVSVASQTLRSVDEKEICSLAFELVSAFDEIVTLGYREKLTTLQVQAFLEMDSHEEKIQEIIERNKEMEATEERRRRAKEIQRKELARRNMELQNKPAFAEPAYAPQPVAVPAYLQPEPDRAHFDRAPARAAGKGLQLGRKPKPAAPAARAGLQGTPLLAGHSPAPAAALGRASPAVSAAHVPLASPALSAAGLTPQPQGLANAGILIAINERVLAQLTREGTVDAAEVKGDLNLRISDPALARAKLLLLLGAGVQYKTHPNVDKALFASESTIALKDRTKLFPSNDQSLGVLRWRAAGPAVVPLVFTAWVSVDGGVASVNLEYELAELYLAAHPTQTLFTNVEIVVPVLLHEVSLADDSGLVSYDVLDDGVHFVVAEIAFDEPAGNFEFSIPADTEDELFPMHVQFDVQHTDNVTEADRALGQVLVLDVVSNDDNEQSLPFTLHSRVATDTYTVV